MVSSAALYAFSLLLSTTALASPASPRGLSSPRHAHADSHPFVIRGSKYDGFAPTRDYSSKSKRSTIAKRCAARKASSSSISSSSAEPTIAPGGVGAAPTTAKPTKTSTSTSSSHSSKHSTTSVSSGGGGGGGSSGGGGGSGVKPANWPTVTQAGPNYKATVATSDDPYLTSISEALNNKGVADYNKVQSGDMTYYETGQVACGDFYTDATYTAAVSHELWDAWPGSADVDTDRSPICGPFVPGRQFLNSAGGYSPAIGSSIGKIIIGGDGRPNCQSGVGLTGQCHIPLTATITNPANGKKAVVKIVDKCAGCAGHGDIDVTPSVFSYLSDMSLGRVPVTWQFNHF